MHPAIREARALLAGYGTRLAAQGPGRQEADAPGARDSDWLLTVNHCLRVEALAVEIARKTPAFPSADLLLLRVAAVLHDIGSVAGREGHAVRGAAVARRFVETSPTLARAGLDADRLASIIAAHSDKGVPSPDLCCAVLKDADLLDLIGAMSVAMHISRLDGRAPGFYQTVCDVLLGREMEFCAGKRRLLATPAAAAILDRRVRFIRRFAAQLRRELREAS